MDLDYVVLPAIILLIGILIIALCVRRFFSLSTKSYRTWRKVLERTVLSVVVLLVAVVAGSSAFNAIALHRFWAVNPPPGAFYSVNDHRMHINCTGSGSPTIVLEAGLGNDALVWGGVQPELSITTRVCSYDRAGFGWSDALPPPRDADHIAAELHELLLQAKVSGPIVLMGHSIAGIYIRDYATRYPAGYCRDRLCGWLHAFAGRESCYEGHECQTTASVALGSASKRRVGRRLAAPYRDVFAEHATL